MIELNDISLSRGAKQLLEHATATINPGEKVGLIGSNGSGKSSLLSLLRGELKEEAGEVYLPKQWRISSVAQELAHSETSALDFVLSGDTEWQTVQDELTIAEETGDVDAIIRLHEVMENIDGYRTSSRASELLHGLGFPPEQHNWPTNAFSGGWQMRLNLARALMKPCELMLLDEPTNHLDLDAIVWLERWLQRFTGTLIIIAHDSIFLDAVVNKIIWVDNKQLTSHKGNYSDFLVWRAEKLALQQKVFEQQQRKRAHLQSFIDRFKAKASKAKQAQSRMKMLNKMEVVANVQAASGIQFSLPAASDCPNPVLQLKEATLGYPGKAILKDINLHLSPQDRIGLLGANGAGKSTLMKILSGEMNPLIGTLGKNTKLKIGYFAQHQVESLELDQTPLWHLSNHGPKATPQAIRSFLGSFGFSGDLAFTPVGVFSGGEKARLVLCMLAWLKPHLLLLDEPTNHLDLEMREALTLALQEFEGAVVLVSHDRQLLDAVVDTFWIVSNGSVTPFEDDLEAYATWLFKERKKEMEKPTASTATTHQKATFKMSQLEKDIQATQQKIATLEQQLSDPSLYEASNHTLFTRLNNDKKALEEQLSALEATWYAQL